MSQYVDAAMRASFEEDGVVVLRGVLKDWIRPLSEAVEQVMQAPSSLSRRHATTEQGTGFFTDVYMWRNHPTFREFAFHSPMAQIASELLESSSIKLYNEHLLVKEPGYDAPTPWHQDQPYFRFSGQQNCSLWLGLDSVTEENGGMRFVRGSHKWNKWFNPAGFSAGESVSSQFDGPVPDVEADPAAYPLVSFDLEPGDCTIHHGLMLHGAPPNRSKTQRRRGISYRFTGIDCVYSKRDYSAPLPYEPDLREGEPLDSELFPTVWPQTGSATSR